MWCLVKQPQFYLIYLMSICSVLFGLFIISSSKAYGEIEIGDEAFLSFVATFSNIFGIFRFIWSISMDYYSFKKVYGVLLII